MGSDRRVQYTKRVIKESFLKLLYDNPISQMTVKAICLEADVNRATFYRHYRDIYDLFEEIETELIEEISFTSYRELFDIRVLTVVYNNQGFFREFFRTDLLSSIIKNANQNFYEEEWKKEELSDDFDAKRFKYEFDYFLCGSEGLVKNWVEDGCQETPDEFAKILEEITSRR